MEKALLGSSKLRSLIEQFSKFFLVGIMNTFVDLLVLNGLTLTTGVTEGSGYAVQKGASFLVAVTFSYLLNKHWTFSDTSTEGAARKFSQFFAVSVVGMLINVTVATVVVSYLKSPINSLLNFPFLTDQLWVSIGALGGTAVGLIWNFVGYKFWVFKK